MAALNSWVLTDELSLESLVASTQGQGKTRYVPGPACTWGYLSPPHDPTSASSRYEPLTSNAPVFNRCTLKSGRRQGPGHHFPKLPWCSHLIFGDKTSEPQSHPFNPISSAQRSTGNPGGQDPCTSLQLTRLAQLALWTYRPKPPYAPSPSPGPRWLHTSSVTLGKSLPAACTSLTFKTKEFGWACVWFWLLQCRGWSPGPQHARPALQAGDSPAPPPRALKAPSSSSFLCCPRTLLQDSWNWFCWSRDPVHRSAQGLLSQCR